LFEVTVEPWQGAIISFAIFGVPAGIWALIIYVFIIKKRIKTAGEVVDVYTKRGDEGKTRYCPVIRFTDKFGQVHTESNGWFSSREPKIGAKRTILYDPYKPARFSFPGPFGIFLGPVILIGIGLFAAFIPLSNYLPQG
jgi:hypothetical protein